MFSKIRFPCSLQKRGINDKNDKNFLSNLTLYKLDQSTKAKVRTLGVNQNPNLVKSLGSPGLFSCNENHCTNFFFK